MSGKVNYFQIGTSFFCVLALMVFSLFFLHQNNYSKCSKAYEIHFQYPVTGLRVGDPVYYHGIPCGHVNKISLKADDIQKTVVKICIFPEFPIKTNSYATIELRSITGGSVIQILGSSNEAALLNTKNQRLPVIQSSPSSLNTTMEQLPIFIQEAANLLKSINEALENKALKQTLDNIRDASKQFDHLIRNIQKSFLDKNNLELLTRNATKFFAQGSEMMTSIKKLAETIERSPSRFLYKDANHGVRLP